METLISKITKYDKVEKFSELRFEQMRIGDVFREDINKGKSAIFFILLEAHDVDEIIGVWARANSTTDAKAILHVADVYELTKMVRIANINFGITTDVITGTLRELL